MIGAAPTCSPAPSRAPSRLLPAVLAILALAAPAAAQEDADGDGYTTEEGDCDDGDEAVHPGATEACNGIDDDCNGEVDEGFDGYAGWPPNGTSDCIDDDGDGLMEIQGDCDDTDAAIHRDAVEICDDDLDNDCDDAVDFEDHDCLAQAEAQSGIICPCDFPDPPQTTAASAARLTAPLMGLAVALRLRRRGGLGASGRRRSRGRP